MTIMTTDRQPQTAIAEDVTTSTPYHAVQSILHKISAVIPVTNILVVTSFPRCGLQVTQMLHPDEHLVKVYAQGLSLQDHLTWQIIRDGSTLTGRQAWGDQGFTNSAYRQQLMIPSGLMYVVAAPLATPVLAGYSGAIHLYRNEAQGAFTQAEQEQLTALAKELDSVLSQQRLSRLPEACRTTRSWRPQLDTHQWVFDNKAQVIIGASAFAQLDEQVRTKIQQAVQQQLEKIDDRKNTFKRLRVADESGDLWTFRSALYERYPALGEGAFVIVCLEPTACEWSTIRPGDFMADEEMERLVPSMVYMRENFITGPGLGDIAKIVHLSPFHFHRRFTESMGLTPKHFMLACQIFRAKRQLLDGTTGLAEIARNCGFAHQSHFTSRFRQISGLTPTRWRRVMRNRIA